MKNTASLLFLLLAVSLVSANFYDDGIFMEKPKKKKSSGPLTAPDNSPDDMTSAMKKMSDLGATLVGKFMFMNRDTGKVLEAITTGKHETLVQSTSSGAVSQIFTVYNTDKGYFILAPNGHALTLDNFGAGNVLVFSKISSSQAQTWTYTMRSGAWGTIQSTVTNQAVDSTIVAQNVLTVYPTRLGATATNGQLWALVKSAC